MPANRFQTSSRGLITLFNTGSLGTLSDRELLECFRAEPGAAAQDAFRILVERHGPMVLGLCRSLVRDQHEAEDAFQATFLVLVRKVASIERRDTVAPWLYGVASRVARRARTRLIRRQKLELPVTAEIPARDREVSDANSTEQLLHQEIARLPESFRKPIVLCCLQGLSYDLAARTLGLKEPTLRGRLERARKRLATRLRARGVPAVLGVPALESVRGGMPPLPPTLIESTVVFSTRWSSVTGLLGGGAVVPASISALAQGVIESMFVQTIRVAAVGLLAAGAIGSIVLAQQGTGRSPDGGAPAVVGTDGVRAEEARITRNQPQEDRAGIASVDERSEKTSLDKPAGHVTSVDYETREVQVSIDRHMGARPQMKMAVIDSRSPATATGKRKGSIELTSVGDTYSHARIIKTDNPIEPIRVGDIVYSPAWSPNRPTRFALVGKIDMNRDSKDDREELKRMIQEAGGEIEFDLPPIAVGKEKGQLSPRIDWYVVDDRPPPRGPQATPEQRVREVTKEARLNGIRPMTIARLLASLGHDMNAPVRGQAEVPDVGAQADKNASRARDVRIRQRLDMDIDADFPKSGTLATLLKHIKKVTTDATFPGIPIYVDPIGLAETNLNMETEIKLDYKSLPIQQNIKMALTYALRAHGLSYEVRDGFLMISSRTGILESRVEEIDRKLDQVLDALRRLAPAK
jgi:RNA polymerase sigma factor (sigma-70 family)